MLNSQKAQSENREAPPEKGSVSAPSLSLPKGGGAIRGIGEKFATNPVTGTGSMTVPIATSPRRSSFGQQLSLSYDSGAGNGPFGFGSSLGLPSVTCKTDNYLPRYRDAGESDVFLLSGAEDLVPVLDSNGQRVHPPQRTVHGIAYDIYPYRPRIEGLFAGIERWVAMGTGISHWSIISRDNVTTLYGFDEHSYIVDPTDPRKVFSYLICRTFDDKGNVTLYKYVAEDGAGVNRSQAYEANRTDTGRAAQCYLKRICYGNAQPYFPVWSPTGVEPPLSADWSFEVVMDYGDHSHDLPMLTHDRLWPVRPDPFSTYRAGFEVRTYRRCQRVLLFHHFPDEKDVEKNCLIRSIVFPYSDEQVPADPKNPIYTFLQSVTQTGYRRQGNSYRHTSLPPLEFEYSQPQIQPAVLTLDADGFANPPEGLDGSRYQWVDLDGEGLSSILTGFGGGWGYKRNLSPLNQTTLTNGLTITAYGVSFKHPTESVLTDENKIGQAHYLPNDLSKTWIIQHIKLVPNPVTEYCVEGTVASLDRAGVGRLRIQIVDKNVGQDVPQYHLDKENHCNDCHCNHWLRKPHCTQYVHWQCKTTRLLSELDFFLFKWYWDVPLAEVVTKHYS